MIIKRRDRGSVAVVSSAVEQDDDVPIVTQRPLRAARAERPVATPATAKTVPSAPLERPVPKTRASEKTPPTRRGRSSGAGANSSPPTRRERRDAAREIGADDHPKRSRRDLKVQRTEGKAPRTARRQRDPPSGCTGEDDDEMLASFPEPRSRVDVIVQEEVKIRRLRQLKDIFDSSPYFDLQDVRSISEEIRESEQEIRHLLEPLTEFEKEVLGMQVTIKQRELMIEKAVANNLLVPQEDVVFRTLVSKQVTLLKLVTRRFAKKI
jgi:hypothetical protein